METKDIKTTVMELMEMFIENFEYPSEVLSIDIQECYLFNDKTREFELTYPTIFVTIKQDYNKGNKMQTSLYDTMKSFTPYEYIFDYQ
jgi:hypothetical protein